ncbi:MAG: hypothetical protein ACKV2T_40560 [Kofleriaceae bacterium]
MLRGVEVGMLRSLKLWIALTVLAGCTDENPVTPLPDAPPADAPPDATPTCAPVTGSGIVHDSNLDAPETWTEAASPHVVMFDTTVSARITIEPCATIRIAGGRTVTFATGGSFVATGTANQPVTFEPLVAGAPWAALRVLTGELSLTHSVVRGGGDPLGGPLTLAGAIVMARSPAATTGALHLADVEIEGSASQGVYLPSAVGFDATSQNLRVHGSASAPIHTYARVLGSIPPGTYTGNGLDRLIISGSGGQVIDNQTMHARGIPYRVGTAPNEQLDVVATAGVALLTIEPGVTIEFQPGGRFRIEPSFTTSPAKAALRAVGTAAQPIVLTSLAAAPAAGDWIGLSFGGAVDVQSVLEHVHVMYAGGATATGSNSCPYPGRTGQNDAAIRIFGDAPPPGQFITSSQIIASARDGIDRGWRSDSMPDFLPTNTFTSVTGCRQTLPRTTAGVCPTTPPCP